MIKDCGGHGIYCESSASPEIRNNKICDNSVAGINCEGGSAPEIANNWIYYNGGGITLYSSNAVIRNNTIFGNTSIWGTTYGMYG